MGPLLFVDWHGVNALFCGLIWFLAFMLLFVILAHVLPSETCQAHAHCAARMAAR